MAKPILHTLKEAAEDGLVMPQATVDDYHSFRLIVADMGHHTFRYALMAMPSHLITSKPKHYAESAAVWLDQERDASGYRGGYFHLFQQGDVELAKLAFRQDVDDWYQLKLTTPTRERKGGELEL